MGSGRKTETIIVQENSSGSAMSSNCSITARKMHKSELGGVIFGCTHETFDECHSEQLFGLPYGHFSYVRNIEAGLPLFLFNYSDRKIHGIYEATSQGQLYLKPFAWTNGESEKSPFPAQVSVRLRTKCHPLIEDQYRKVLEKSYYGAPQHFWFELDREQTRQLTSLFKPSYHPTKSALPKNPTNTVLPKNAANTVWPTVTAQTGEASQTTAGFEHNNEHFPPLTSTTWKDIVKKDLKPSSGFINENKFASLFCEDEDSEHGIPTETSSSNVLDDMEWKEPVDNWEELADDIVQNTSSSAVYEVPERQPNVNEVSMSDHGRVLSKLEQLVANRKRCLTDNNMFENSAHALGELSLSEKSNASGFSGHAVVGECSNVSDLDVEEFSKVKEWVSYFIKKHQVESDKELEQMRNAVRDAWREIQMLKDRVKELESIVDAFTYSVL